MEGDLDDEMRFHVEARAEQLMRERALPRADSGAAGARSNSAERRIIRRSAANRAECAGWTI